MEKQDRTRQLEHLGLEMHQVWMGRVCSWNPVESMQYAMQPDLLPESRTLFNDLLRMNQSWIKMTEQWSGVMDSGMPWHWNEMGNEQVSLSAVPEQPANSSTTSFPTNWPGQPLPEVKSKVVPPKRHIDNQPVGLVNELQKKNQLLQPETTLPKAKKQSLKVNDSAKAQDDSAVSFPDTKEEKRNHSTVKPAISPEKERAELHEERKSMDQPREEPQVTFRRLDDFAAMFRPGTNQSTTEQLNQHQVENRSHALPIPPVTEGPTPDLPPVHALENRTEKPVEHPLSQANKRNSTSAPPLAMNPPATQLKPESRPKVGIQNQPVQKATATRQKPTSDSAQPEAIAKESKRVQQSATPVPAWEDLQKEWDQLGNSTQLHHQTASRNLSTHSQSNHAPANPKVQTETDSTVVQTSVMQNEKTGGLKPVSSRYEVETRPLRELQNQNRNVKDQRVEIEDVMDQMLDQLQRDFKRYYGG